MIDWSKPIVTTCGRPARVTGQYSNGPISIAVQFIANNGDLYELNLCSNAKGQVHGGMYQLVNDVLAMLSAVDEHSPEHAIPAIDVAKAAHPQPPDFESLYSGDELPPLRDAVHAVMRCMRVIRHATPPFNFNDYRESLRNAEFRMEHSRKIGVLLAQLGESRIRIDGYRIRSSRGGDYG